MQDIPVKQKLCTNNIIFGSAWYFETIQIEQTLYDAI